METLIGAATWWGVLTLLSIVALPVVLEVFGSLPSRGYPLARSGALLLVSYAVWILNVTGLLSFTRLNIALVAVAVAVLGVALMARGDWRLGRETASFFAREWRFVIACELIFALAFGFLVVLRGFTPELLATEKPMDSAFLNAILRHDRFAPQDPWLAGQPFNYYYFGHYIVATVTKLAGIVPPVAFNLAVAMFFGLLAVSVFGLVFDMTTGLASGRRAQGYLLGLLGSTLAVLAGNLYAGSQLVANPASTLAADWWRGPGWKSSRIIVDVIFGETHPTINEFPFFSFSLADMHAHVMVLPFAVMALAAAAAALRSRGQGWLPSRTAPLPPYTVYAGLTIGSLYLINSWDLPTYFLILSACLFLATPAPRNVIRALLGAGWTLFFAMGLYLPFHVLFKSAVGSSTLPLPPDVAGLPLVSRLSSYIGIVIWEKTTLVDFLMIFGLFLYVIGPFILFLSLKRSPGDKGRRSYVKVLALEGVVLVLAVASVLFRFPLLLILPPLVALGLVHLWKAKPDGPTFPLLLGVVGFLMVFGCEIIFLQDAFHDRMNTVFKFYYQIWLLFAVATPVALLYVWRHLASWLAPTGDDPWWKGIVSWPHLWLGGFVALLALGMVYPVLSTWKKVEAGGRFKGLDGAAYLEHTVPSDYHGIQWLNENVEGTAVVLEASGPPYAEFSRVANFTGLPTVLGWMNHERVWRAGEDWAAELDQRARDIDTIYSTTDLELAGRLLAKYDVEYVFVGTLERGLRGPPNGVKDYPPAGLAKFSSLGDVVFAEGDTIIYRVQLER